MASALALRRSSNRAMNLACPQTLGAACWVHLEFILPSNDRNYDHLPSSFSHKRQNLKHLTKCDFVSDFSRKSLLGSR